MLKIEIDTEKECANIITDENIIKNFMRDAKNVELSGETTGLRNINLRDLKDFIDYINIRKKIDFLKSQDIVPDVDAVVDSKQRYLLKYCDEVTRCKKI